MKLRKIVLIPSRKLVGSDRQRRDVLRELGLKAKSKRKCRYNTASNHDLPVADNLLKQSFTAKGRDRIWLTDITWINTDEGPLYLACVLDMYLWRIVGWSISPSPRAQLVVDALKMAIGRRAPSAGLIVHSDRGRQYGSHLYQNLLAEKEFILSMSGKGNCWDNAPMESFFASLKTELKPDKPFDSRSEARSELYRYIELFYNGQRLHSSLDYQSPLDYEKAQC